MTEIGCRDFVFWAPKVSFARVLGLGHWTQVQQPQETMVEIRANDFGSLVYITCRKIYCSGFRLLLISLEVKTIKKIEIQPPLRHFQSVSLCFEEFAFCWVFNFVALSDERAEILS